MTSPDGDDDLLRALARLELALLRLRRGEGDARGRGRRGGRVEFAGHRAYVPGDDVRTIDWAAHARTGRLHVKEFARDDDLQAVLVVDASASMGLHGKLATALRVAYALGWVALRSGGRARLAVASDGALAVGEEGSGASGAAALRAALGRVRAGGRTSLAASLARLPPAPRGARLVVVLSDLLSADDVGGAVATLVERGDDVILLHVRSAADLDAACEGDADEDVVLEDAETGERLAFDAGASDRARLAAAGDEERWRAFAGRHSLRYVPLDADEPLGAATVRALRSAGILA